MPVRFLGSGGRRIAELPRVGLAERNTLQQVGQPIGLGRRLSEQAFRVGTDEGVENDAPAVGKGFGAHDIQAEAADRSRERREEIRAVAGDDGEAIGGVERLDLNGCARGSALLIQPVMRRRSRRVYGSAGTASESLSQIRERPGARPGPARCARSPTPG